MGTWRMFLRMCPYFFQDDWLKIDGEISIQKFFAHFNSNVRYRSLINIITDLLTTLQAV